MGDNGSLTRAQHLALFRAFLSLDCVKNPELCKEVQSLCRDLNDNEATFYDVDYEELEDDEHLEVDGHTSSNFALESFEPEPAILQVAAELNEIAARLEQNAVLRATENLTRNLSRSPTQHWEAYLDLEVQNILAHGVGLDNLQQERVMAALTFILVKGVCQQIPGLLRNLFDTALQYLSPQGGR